MWQKQHQVGNHVTCAPFEKLVVWKIWKRSNRIWGMKLQSSRIQGTTIKWRRYNLGQKASSLSQGEESNNCALAHCRCKNAAENFDRHVIKTLSQNYSRQDLFQDFRALKVLVFRAVWVEYPNSMLARFRVRERIYLSVRFIFKIPEVKGQPDGFSWLVKDRITSAKHKTLNSLLCFLQVQNCWRWLSLILSSSSTKKRDPDKNQVVLCSHAEIGFALGRWS